MKPKKRDNYKLTGSIHTMQIKSEYPCINELDNRITTCLIKNGEEAKSIINPNRNGDIFSFMQLKSVMEEILKSAYIDEYRIIRADLRLDSYESKHYKEYSKLNKYLISALAIEYSVENDYRACNLWTDKQVSLAIKNEYLEVENYDRSYKNTVLHDDDKAKARLEERTKAKQWRTHNSLQMCDNEKNMQMLEKEFVIIWGKRWKKAIRSENLKAVQDKYNDALAQEYFDGLNAYPVQFRSLTDFLIQNQKRIFTTRQMVSLLRRIGIENAEDRAKYHKKKYGIEYFSQADVKHAVKEIERATRAFFES